MSIRRKTRVKLCIPRLYLNVIPHTHNLYISRHCNTIVYITFKFPRFDMLILYMYCKGGMNDVLCTKSKKKIKIEFETVKFILALKLQ